MTNKYRNSAFLLATRTLIILFIILISACGVVPIYIVDNAEYVSINGKVPLKQAKEAIVRAGNKSKWQMEEIKPGHLIAMLRVHVYKITVDIKYNSNTFSITHKDSSNLEFDGLHIDPKYNRWIQNLQNDINEQFDNM